VFQRRATVLAVVTLGALSTISFSGDKKADTPASKISSGAKVYVAAISDGFDTYLKAAIEKKKVPLQVVEKREDADYEITGTSETHKAGTAKILITGSWHSNEEASIRMSDLKSGEVVWAYSANKQNSAHGKQSTAEACAKHLKGAIEGK
jgi:hypothetical protein